MRIAYLINQYPTISHTFIRREIRALERLGFEVMRISLRGWDSELADEDDRDERARTRYVLRAGASGLLAALARMLIKRPVQLVRALKLAWRMSRTSDRPLLVHLAYVAEACRIEPWLRKQGVKHLHAHFGTNSAEVAMLVHVLGGPRWSFTAHGPEEFDKAPLLGLAEKLRRCSFVVAVSSFGRSQLFRLLDYHDWPKVHVVHCGIDGAFLSADTKPAAVHRLLCIGRLCEQKGQLLLVEAAQRLACEGTDFEMVLAGDGPMRGQIERLLKRHDLADRVQITGWISGAQVREQILAARALVLPSFAEGLPVVLMEAMALRRPVISTYIAGIPELVCPGENGWLVPPGDLTALVAALRACLEASSDVMDRMGEDARKRVLERYDVNSEAQKLQRLFLSP
jgi:colanic acid/amylovoran biosynthesis glycosyltransferase